MKKMILLLSIFGIIGFTMLEAGNNTTVASAKQELKTMAEVLQDEFIIINEWSLYSREIMDNVKTKQDQEKVVVELKDKFSDWSWNETKQGEQHTITATTVSAGYDERIKIILTDTYGQLSTNVLYEVKGYSWDRQSEDFLGKEWQNRLFDIFRENATTFSCIKGESNDKIDTALPTYMNRLLKAFNAEEIEALEEQTFMSTSASSPLFSGTVSKDHDMNLQLGLRKTDRMGGNTTIVVGTPIITIEY